MITCLSRLSVLEPRQIWTEHLAGKEHVINLRIFTFSWIRLLQRKVCNTEHINAGVESFESSVHFSQAGRCHVPEDSNLYNQLLLNLK
jgi:hypothetical protein